MTGDAIVTTFINFPRLGYSHHKLAVCRRKTWLEKQKKSKLFLKSFMGKGLLLISLSLIKYRQVMAMFVFSALHTAGSRLCREII